MIICRHANDQLAAIHIAEVLDLHNLVVVSMVPVSDFVEDKEAMRGMDNRPVMIQRSYWMIVAQGEDIDYPQIDRDIEEKENGPKTIVESLEEIDRIIEEAEGGEEDDLRHGKEPVH